MGDEATDAAIREARDRATAKIVDSTHRLRVIVAGPGTGKSFVFGKALTRSGGKGLALTFIRKLADDLAQALGPKAETYTFHKYAKMLVYRHTIAGLTDRFILYPPLAFLTDRDIEVLDGMRPAWKQLEQAMQDLAPDPLIESVMNLGTYYDAAAFVDVVYRVYRHQEGDPASVEEYPLVVVDEYQDFTRLETEFIAQLGRKSPLLIAGDDDQALYAFRFASAEYVRELAASVASEQHELPYCSRCPLPVVEAVKTVIRVATSSGRLPDRLSKPYECFMPDKREATERYPRILNVRCTKLEIMARYVEAEIARIPAADVDRSNAGAYPTVLIVGKSHFVKAIHRHIAQRYPQAKFKQSGELEPTPLDGYRRIVADDRSNLGWRILLHIDPIGGWEGMVREALTTDTPLVDQLPEDYRERHLAIGEPLATALAGNALGDDERGRLVAALRIEDEDLEDLLMLPEDPDEAAAADEDADGTGVTIRCTTLPGAKGLSAEHVFIAGVMEGTFPEVNATPTDKEICEFLVALSRTRTACHLLSAKQFGRPSGRRRAPPRPKLGVFADWIVDHCEQLERSAADLPLTRS